MDVAGLQDDWPPNLTELGGRLGLNPYHLQLLFTRRVGPSPWQCAAAACARRFRALLRTGEPVGAAVYGAGCGSGSRADDPGAVGLGMTPATDRRGGRGAEIRYVIAPSPTAEMGRVLVAATDRGICMVAMGDSDVALVAELAREFPAAAVRSAPDGMSRWVEAVQALSGGGTPPPGLPLDVQATAFQWRVWQALQAIPMGETRSYSQVAAGLGQPSAARAVARACATNPVALVIPCHRVVRADGDLGGYRWGIQRKRLLLTREEAAGQSREGPGGGGME